MRNAVNDNKLTTDGLEGVVNELAWINLMCFHLDGKSKVKVTQAETFGSRGIAKERVHTFKKELYTLTLHLA